MTDSEMQERITELVQGLWADGYAEGSRGENVPPSKKRLNRTEAEDALMSLFTEGTVKAENAVIDKAHTPCECGKDHFGTPVRSVQGNITTHCQFSRIVLSATKEHTKGGVENEPLLSIPKPENRRELNLEPKEKK